MIIGIHNVLEAYEQQVRSILFDVEGVEKMNLLMLEDKLYSTGRIDSYPLLKKVLIQLHDEDDTWEERLEILINSYDEIFPIS